jgi:nucleoid DNA-binding protein
LEEEAMTKADLVEEVHEAIGPGVTKKDCAAVVDAFLNAIKRAISDGEHIEIRGFGTFKVRERRTRMARNPRTGDPVRVPARAVPVFKPSRLFKEEVGESQDESDAPDEGDEGRRAPFSESYRSSW